MRGTALLIDDNPMDIRIISTALERIGFACQSFTDGQEGLNWASGNAAQYILLDLQMPTLSGYDLIPIFKRSPLNSEATIIITSGNNQIEDVKRAILLGASDYIIKPVDPLVLQEKLRKLEDDRTATSEFSQITLHSPAHRSAHIIRPIELLELSEFGFRARLRTPITVGEAVELDDLAEDIFGTRHLVGRCLNLETTDDGSQISQFTFVGLTEKQRQFIRMSCRKLWIEQKENNQSIERMAEPHRP